MNSLAPGGERELGGKRLKSAEYWASLPMSVGVNRFSGPGSIGRSGERKLEVLNGIESRVKKVSMQ